MMIIHQSNFLIKSNKSTFFSPYTILSTSSTFINQFAISTRRRPPRRHRIHSVEIGGGVGIEFSCSGSGRKFVVLKIYSDMDGAGQLAELEAPTPLGLHYVPPSPTGRRTYDVFINFCGEDTRNNFVNHLYAALDQAGIYTFKDDEELPRGESIHPVCMKAIEESRVAVVVFLQNYAESSCCLDELVKIVECRDLIGQEVLPVFYQVPPSLVRSWMSLSGNDMMKVKSWGEALSSATSLRGWFVDWRNEADQCIKEIIPKILRYTRSHQTKNVIEMSLPDTVTDGVLVTSSSSMSTVAPTRRWSYDVFLSFRGEDTRNNFVDHLYSALDKAGIYTFKDDEKLQRGKSITPELVKAIQESMVAVVVFSKNYANSSWCLDELAKIIECRDLTGQRVLPVFYDVNPSDVRGQKRTFHTALEQHELKLIDIMEKVRRWRKALVTATNLSGWDVSKTASGHEAECISKIVWTILNYNESRPTEDLIGMGSRVQHVMSLLGKGSDDFCIIGIWGMGGIGKTTLARAVYHQISYEFEGSCFLEDVRENGCDKKGLQSLQEKLLSEILMEKHFRVKDCDDGLRQIQRRLGRKKILVVLDDVDNIKQLEFLAGDSKSFGPGSRIIITTRDEHLLTCAQEKYTPELLNENEAMNLFSRYAFKENIPSKAYEELSRVVIRHTGHLPLALKVLGSHFCGRNLNFWKSGLNVLAKIQHKEINEMLRLSYDGLNILEKKILLHIACLFKGRERRDVTRILDSFGFEAESGITVLIQKSLLTISKGDIRMHNLIQEMGRCIVRECYPNTLIWRSEEIKELMTKDDRLETVEAIVETNSTLSYSAEVFKSMKKLRLLEVKGKFTSSELTYFPEELRWLFWSEYPFQFVRITRGMTNLVGLELPFGRMKKLQIEEKIIHTNLKFMDLHDSSPITSFPDISGVPNLESLNLSRCSSLVEVHQSVLLHDSIVNLDLSLCESLKILPTSIKMKSLQTLLLNDCRSLERFPEVTGEMGTLLVLDIDGCDRIRALPSSIRLFTGLTVLYMGNYCLSKNLEPELKQNYLRIQSSFHLSSLRVLGLKDSNLVHDDFPSNLHNTWSSLEELDLRRNPITRLPESISHISFLKYINLRNCTSLRELHELPSLVQVLRADGCKSLEKIGDLSNKYKWLFKISLRGCADLLKDEESESHVAGLLMKSLVQRCAAVNHRLSVAVPGSKIPNWFSNRQTDNKIALNMPQNQITRIRGLAICFLFYSHYMEVGVSFRIKFRASGEEKLIARPIVGSESANHVWMGYMSINLLQNLCRGFESQDLIIHVESGLIMECGVCLIYRDEIQPMTGIESWIPDYDELGRIDHDNPIEALQHKRWSRPSFSFGNEKTGDHNTVYLDL